MQIGKPGRAEAAAMTDDDAICYIVGNLQGPVVTLFFSDQFYLSHY